MPEDTLQALVGSLLPADIAVRCWPLADDPPPPWPEEAAAVARAVDRRRREFAAGRHAAREALAALGLAPCAIPAGSDRSPRWPGGIVGSISHDPHWCIAVAGHASRWAGLGVDIERVDRFDPHLERMVCTPAERARLPEDVLQRPIALAWVFTVKEAVYKAQHPHTGAWLDFSDVEVAWPAIPQGGACRATLTKAAGPYAAGTAWTARCGLHGDHAVAALALPAAR